MAAPRMATRLLRQATAQPFTSISSSLSGPWRCPQCSRTFASSRPYRDTSRRHLQTATAYQPSSVPSHTFPQAPRNSDVPSTSIAGETASADGPQSSRSTEKRSSDSGSSVGTGTVANMTEYEAQKTKVVTPPPSTPSSPSGFTRPKRSKLRARKAAMTLTPTAVEQLRNLLDQPDPKLIRVGVKNRGCSGLAYHLEYVDKPGMFDETVEQDGVKVLVDSKALFSIIGSEMDWLEDKLSARFVFKNPNITEQCGCGESFSIG